MLPFMEQPCNYGISVGSYKEILKPGCLAVLDFFFAS